MESALCGMLGTAVVDIVAWAPLAFGRIRIVITLGAGGAHHEAGTFGASPGVASSVTIAGPAGSAGTVGTAGPHGTAATASANTYGATGEVVGIAEGEGLHLRQAHQVYTCTNGVRVYICTRYM